VNLSLVEACHAAFYSLPASSSLRWCGLHESGLVILSTTSGWSFRYDAAPSCTFRTWGTQAIDYSWANLMTCHAASTPRPQGLKIVMKSGASHCNTLQHTLLHCITLHHTASHCITLHHTASHCIRLPHTATHCNTLQHTATQGMVVPNSRLSVVVSRIHIAGYYTLTHIRTQMCIHRRNRMDVLERYFHDSFICGA